MAMIEIDESAIEELGKYKTLVERLHGDKTTKRDFERMVKKANPNAVTTDDIAAPYVDEVKQELESLKEWKKGMEGRITDYNRSEQIRNLRDAGYTEDGIKAIEEISKNRNVDLEMAAAYFDKTRPSNPIAPNGLSPLSWNKGFGDDSNYFDELLKADDAGMDALSYNKANEAWNELQSMKGR